MTVFCDTSVLVAACVRQHPHFAPARAVLDGVAAGRLSGAISVHSLAETFSALTSLPVLPRILPIEADRIIRTNLRPHFRGIAVTPDLYAKAIDACVRQSLGGGKVYDALLLECARKAACDRILTFNVGDFRRIAPDLADRIATP